ncbi:MAG: SDR family oxidoreductase [Pirellulales bacterium]|nr:SDR family oxidoreductase [Pirellulales bacterium]
MSKLIFGCGYLGSRVARLWRDAGEEVIAVTRSKGRAEKIQADGIRPIVADINDRDSLGELPAVDTVLFAVGYDRSIPADQRRSIGDVYAGGLANVLDALSHDIERVIYISSTGVYGNSGGDWVDEDTPCEPTREGGRACLAAERVLEEHELGARGIILRLAGIYGPNRVPRLKELAQGEPIEVSADGMLNLIHVDDAARAVVATAERATPPRTYCVSDGNPVLRREWLREAAQVLDLPEPKFVQPDSNDTQSRASSSKRIRNDRIVRELEFSFALPSYREGLRQIANGG